MLDGVGLAFVGRSGVAAEMRNDVIHAATAMNPGAQPGADVTSAGDGGQIIEAAEESVIGESLDGAEGESRAADSAGCSCWCTLANNASAAVPRKSLSGRNV
jgi:hypothetical protein